MTIIYSGFTHWKRWLSIAFCRFTRLGTPFLSFSRFPCLTETDGHHCHVNVTVLKQLKACRFTWPIHTNSIFSWLGTFPLLKSVEYNSSKLSNWSTYTTCAPATRPTWPPQPCLKRCLDFCKNLGRQDRCKNPAASDDLWLWHVIWLVVATPLKNMKVNEKDYPYILEKRMHVPNHQTIIIN